VYDKYNLIPAETYFGAGAGVATGLVVSYFCPPAGLAVAAASGAFAGIVKYTNDKQKEFNKKMERYGNAFGVFLPAEYQDYFTQLVDLRRSAVAKNACVVNDSNYAYIRDAMVAGWLVAAKSTDTTLLSSIVSMAATTFSNKGLASIMNESAKLAEELIADVSLLSNHAQIQKIYKGDIASVISKIFNILYYYAYSKDDASIIALFDRVDSVLLLVGYTAAQYESLVGISSNEMDPRPEPENPSVLETVVDAFDKQGTKLAIGLAGLFTGAYFLAKRRS
jgi:hypothetical protein